MPGVEQTLEHLALARVEVALRCAQPKMRFVCRIAHHSLTGHTSTGESLHKPLHPRRSINRLGIRRNTSQALRVSIYEAYFQKYTSKMTRTPATLQTWPPS